MPLDKNGHEVPDPTPVEVPLRFRGRPDEVARLKNLIRTAMSEFAQENQKETFEEANDFDVEEDHEFELHSPHEVPDDDPEFQQYARDASIDDEGKREYVRRRSRGQSDRDTDEEVPMYGRRKGDNEAHSGRGRSRGPRRPDPEQRSPRKGDQFRSHAGRHADAEQRRVRPYRDTSSGEVIDPRDFDDSD